MVDPTLLVMVDILLNEELDALIIPVPTPVVWNVNVLVVELFKNET
jgi:hypothetical protein